jgi:hypothetical protein
MAGTLEVNKAYKNEKVPNVQAVRCWIESSVDCPGFQRSFFNGRLTVQRKHGKKKGQLFRIHTIL